MVLMESPVLELELVLDLPTLEQALVLVLELVQEQD